MTPTAQNKRDKITERTADWLETFYIAWLKEAKDLKDSPIPYSPKDKVEARKAKDALMKAWKERTP